MAEPKNSVVAPDDFKPGLSASASEEKTVSKTSKAKSTASTKKKASASKPSVQTRKKNSADSSSVQTVDSAVATSPSSSPSSEKAAPSVASKPKRKISISSMAKKGASNAYAARRRLRDSRRHAFRVRRVPKFDPDEFSSKAFQETTEILARALVRHEQKALVKANLADGTFPVIHTEDGENPNQVMKLPKSQPGTRPGRAAMVGNQPLDPLQYEPRHRSEDYSKPYLKEEVFLASDRAQRIFESAYNNLNVSFSMFATVLRRFDNESFLKTEADIVSGLNKLEKHLSDQIADVVSRLDSVIEDENHRVAFNDHERKYIVPIHTPWSSRFVTVVTLFDTYMSRVNAALLTGVFSYSDADELVKTVGDLILAFARMVNHLVRSRIAEAKKKSGRKADIGRAEQVAEKAAKKDGLYTDDPHPETVRSEQKEKDRV